MHFSIAHFNFTDVVHLLCSAVQHVGTLYNLSLSSRLYSSVALSALYSNLVKFPADDEEDRLAEDANTFHSRLTKWSSLWRSLALSALNSNSTVINYAACIRVLNLRDLLCLMEEFRIPRAGNARQAFFRGGLEECNKTRKHIGQPDIVFDYNSSADSVADIIIPGTRNVTTLIRQTTELPSSSPGHLFRWLNFMPGLESLRMFSAEAFEDERARDAVARCRNLKSLEIYLWTDNRRGTSEMTPDEAFSQLLSTIKEVQLKRLAINHGETLFQQLALSGLSHYHGDTLAELEIQDISEEGLLALNIATNITNLRSCILNYTGPGNFFEDDPPDYCEAISQFLIRNRALESLDLSLEAIRYVLPPVLNSSLRLKRLCITDHSDTVFPDILWQAFASQSNSLECLILRRVFPDPELFTITDAMVNAIRLLYKLKVLTIMGFAESVTDSDIQAITSSCRDIEELSLASPHLSNDALTSLSTLPRLTTFLSQYFLLLSRTDNRAPNLITWWGLSGFIDATPTLSLLTIYMNHPYLPSPMERKLRERMESRNGWFIVVEGGNFPLNSFVLIC